MSCPKEQSLYTVVVTHTSDKGKLSVIGNETVAAWTADAARTQAVLKFASELSALGEDEQANVRIDIRPF